MNLRSITQKKRRPASSVSNLSTNPHAKQIPPDACLSRSCRLLASKPPNGTRRGLIPGPVNTHTRLTCAYPPSPAHANCTKCKHQFFKSLHDHSPASHILPASAYESYTAQGLTVLPPAMLARPSASHRGKFSRWREVVRP